MMDSPPNFSTPVDQSGSIVCAQCGAPMPSTMRFCRSCGQRLGEGPAEYTETVRFPNTAQQATGARFTAPFTPNPNAPLARQAAAKQPRRRWGLTGMTWMWIGLGVFFAGGGVLSMFKSPNIRPPRISAPAPSKSYFGVNSFTTTDAGATFRVVEPPGSPADKAGMVGGDTVISFDGRPVRHSDDITNLLRQTPIGKTVEVLFLRDGEMKQTQLTTISKEEFDRLKEAFDDRPEGKGFLGYEADKTTEISRPETKIYGVRLDKLYNNRPAILFGLKEGDIITEFDGVPIRTSAELLSRVKRAIPGKVVKIVVIRDGQRVEVPVTMGTDE